MKFDLFGIIRRWREQRDVKRRLEAEHARARAEWFKNMMPRHRGVVFVSDINRPVVYASDASQPKNYTLRRDLDGWRIVEMGDGDNA